MSKKNTQSSQPRKTSQLPKEEVIETGSEESISEEVVVEAKPVKGAKAHFGNQDKDKKHDLSKLKIPKDHYVVRHFSSVELANGQKMEDPSTNRFQVYDKETFENLNRQSVKDGKQIASQFNSLGLNVEVLHDPTK